jgi:hypothetical protein
VRRRTRVARGFGVALLLLLVAVPSMASAATTVRVFSGSPYFSRGLTPAAPPPVTIGAHALVRLGGVPPGYAAAGVQGPASGLEGTTLVLPPCGGACTDRYRPASSPALAARHFTERVTLTVVQPRHVGPAVGFDVEVAVHLTTGWVVGVGYFSTGLAPGATTATITLLFFIDLGAVRPTVTAVEVTVNRCTLMTGCP